MRSSEATKPISTLGVALHAAGAVGVGLGVMGADPSALAQTAADQTHADTDKSANVSGIVVTGIRPLLGSKIPSSVQDTPQSVNIVSGQLLREQSVSRLEDALKSVPGVTLNAGEGAARGETDPKLARFAQGLAARVYGAQPAEALLC